MINEQLVQYIQEGIVKGKSKDDIYKELLNAGWSLEVIQENFRDQPSSIEVSEGHRFSFVRTLYYLGGFLIVIAIAYFLGTNWYTMGDSGRIAFPLLLCILFGYIGIELRRNSLFTGSSVLILAATVCIPIIIYSIELAIGIWPSSQYESFLLPASSKGAYAWLILDLVTLILAGVVFRIFKYPILTLPVSHFFWFLIMDIMNAWKTNGAYDLQTYIIKSWVSLAAGVILVLGGIYYHKRQQQAEAVWPWIYGLGLMFGSLVFLRFVSEEPGFELIYQCLILIYGLVTLYLATPFKSKVFLVFGAFGVFWFVQDIAWTYFRESLGFSVVLMLSGLLTIGLAVLLQQYYRRKLA